jgi:NADPH:quinone reductase-like Zn-dependent oxidoreductase
VQTPDWEKDVLRLTGGGADLVLEVGGSKTVAKSIASVKPGGSVIVIGAVSGPGAAVEPMSLIAGSVRLQGVYVGSRQMHEDLARFITVAGLRPVVGASFAFADLPAACAHFAAGKHFGKVALTFGG